MATRLIEVEVGQGTVLVEAVVPPGTEPTVSPRAAGQKVLAALDALGDVVVDLATRVGDTAAKLAERGLHPDEVSVELGLSISTTGTLIFVSGTADAHVAVTLTYRRAD